MKYYQKFQNIIPYSLVIAELGHNILKVFLHEHMALHNFQGADVTTPLSDNFLGSDSHFRQGMEVWHVHIRTIGNTLKIMIKVGLAHVKEEIDQTGL